MYIKASTVDCKNASEKMQSNSLAQMFERPTNAVTDPERSINTVAVDTTIDPAFIPNGIVEQLKLWIALTFIKTLTNRHIQTIAAQSTPVASQYDNDTLQSTHAGAKDGNTVPHFRSDREAKK